MKNAVILGAGITGLYIAKKLQQAGYKVTVIEKTQKIGGMTASFKYNDCILDYGPHKFYTQLPGVYEEFKKIVGDGNYSVVEKKNSVRLLGRYFDFPVKISQLVFSIPILTSMGILLDFAKSSLKKREVISYEDYFINGFGKTGYEIIFKGFAEKVWGNPKKLSEELARRRSPVGNVFDLIKSILIKNKNMSAEYFYYPKNGYGEICNSLSRYIVKAGGKILFSTVPTSLDIKNNKIKSLSVLFNRTKKKLRCDVLISTTAINELPRLIKNTPGEVLKAAENLKFRSLIICFVFVNRDRVLKDNWIFFPEKEFCFNRVAEQKSFSSLTVPKGKTVLTAEITCDFQDKLYNSTEEEIKKMILGDLEKAELIKKEEVFDFFTRKAGRVYPVYSLDYKSNLNTVLGYFDTIGNLYTVGRLGLFNYNNADHCIDMGKVTAELIIKEKGAKYWKKARDYFDSYRIVD